MPQLNEFDDYEECMDVYQKDGKYCNVKSAIKPDISSQTYAYIADFSSRKKQHFRHDRLTRGICLNKCIELIESLGIEAEYYYEPDFDNIGSNVTYASHHNNNNDLLILC